MGRRRAGEEAPQALTSNRADRGCGGRHQGEPSGSGGMTDALRVTTIDAAARFGWAHGQVGETPISGVQYFAKSGPGASYANVMLGAMRWTTDFLTRNPTDILCVERALPDSASDLQTNFKTSEMKNGLIGIIVATARLLGVRNAGLMVGEEPGEHRLWRSTAVSTFLPKKPKGGDAKALARQKCIDLGWITPEEARADVGYDRSDALMIWYAACVLVDPRRAPPVDPLFMAAERRRREAERLAERYADPVIPERF